ncbi:MAG: serine hydrolase, partial [Anaerolineales bacterium]
QQFAQYENEHILQPLEMQTATFQQPIPASRSRQQVTGYRIVNGELAAKPVTYTRQVGAGGLTATGHDISHFMMAYLAEGGFNDNQILQPSTVGQMMDNRFSSHPELMGIVSGFWEAVVNQHHVLYHTGDTLSFSSLLALMPESNTGVFVAYNRVTDTPRWNILDGILTQCWDTGNYRQSAFPSFKPGSSKPFSGTYQSVRIDSSTPARLLAFGWETKVRAKSNGQIEIDGQEYNPIGPELFQQVEGAERVAFRLNRKGEGTHLFFDTVPTMAFERLSWWETSVAQIIALVVPLLVFLANLVNWGVSIFRKKQLVLSVAHWIAAGMSLLGIATAGLAGAAMTNANEIVFGLPVTLQIGLWLGWPFVLLAVLSSGFALRAWMQKLWTPLQRLYYTLVAFSGVVFIWFLNYWNLVPDLNALLNWLTI